MIKAISIGIKIIIAVILAVIFVVEPVLFTLQTSVSIHLLLLKQTWAIQAAFGFCLSLIGLKHYQILLALAVALALVGESFLFTLSDRALAALIILPLLVFPFQVAFGFCLALIIPRISAWSRVRSIITLGVAIPFFFWMGTLMEPLFWRVEHLRDTIQLDNYRYYLTTKLGYSGPGCDFYCNFNISILHQCDLTGMACRIIFNDEGVDVIESGLAVDKEADEIQLFLAYFDGVYSGSKNDDRLVYVYGKQPRRIRGLKEFDDRIYYLTSFYNTYAFDQCDQSSLLPCEHLPFHAGEENNTSYMLYQCDQSSLHCKRLPFEYVDKSNDEITIDIKNNGELSVSAESYGVGADEFLVYTYNIHSSHPVCQVEGCILIDR